MCKAFKVSSVFHLINRLSDGKQLTFRGHLLCCRLACQLIQER